MFSILISRIIYIVYTTNEKRNTLRELYLDIDE